MDMIELRRRVMLSMGSAKIYSGTYIPETTGSDATIDTGKTGWTHFLIVAHVLPYVTPMARCLCLKFYDFDTEVAQMMFGGSSDESNMASSENTFTSSTTKKFSDTVSRNGSEITFSNLIAGQGGKFQAGTQYDWYAW